MQQIIDAAAPRKQSKPAQSATTGLSTRSRTTALDLAKLIAGKRRNEIEALIRYCYGSLPDTNDRDVQTANLLSFAARAPRRAPRPPERRT
jgi:hypothetical protein